MSVFKPILGSALGPLEQQLLTADTGKSGWIPQTGIGGTITRTGDNLNKLTRPDGSVVYFDDFGNIVE